MAETETKNETAIFLTRPDTRETKRTDPDTEITDTETLADPETIYNVARAKGTTEDYMKDTITADTIPGYIQKRDIVAIDKNAKFSVSQLVNTSRIFKSLVELSWVESIRAYEKLRSGLKYHGRVDISDFIQIFDEIKVEIDPNSGILFTPPAQPYETATLKYQIGIKIGKSVIHINNLKIALYNFLMRKTIESRVKKLEAIKQKREGLLLLVIACSIGLPTRKFTNAYDFFEIFAEKYTIVNDSNIIRTLLNLNGIDVGEVKEYGNRALELWEIYKEKFPHFKSIDDDNDDTKTLYSYPTATELRHLVLRANKVIENILVDIDLDEAVEVETNVSTVTASDTVETKESAAQEKDTQEKDRLAAEAAEKKKIAKAAEPGQLFSKKPLNFLMSI